MVVGVVDRMAMPVVVGGIGIVSVVVVPMVPAAGDGGERKSSDDEVF